MNSSINASKIIIDNENNKIISKEEAEEAVKTLIRYIGEDPEREGLLETPKRVIKSFNEFYAGYSQDPEIFLSKTFEDIEGYNDIVMLKNINFESHCEHHMVPIIGRASIGYYPDKRVVGISKLARVLDLYAKRLQTQETMTAQIADTIDRVLQPRGVAVVIDAEHQCMSSRGVHKHGSSTITSRMLGVFRDNQKSRMEFMTLISN